MPHYTADLHIHSRFSRATSSRLTLPHLAAWAAIKGIQVLGTGDLTHPQWRAEMHEQLEFDELTGLYRLRNNEASRTGVLAELRDVPRKTAGMLLEAAMQVRFLLQGEISSIYKRCGKVHKVHTLIYLPSLERADAFSKRLEAVGNIVSDGRPILGLDCANLLDMLLQSGPEAYLIPAHIWTPWFSMFGSKSGFDTIEECFGGLSRHIFAVETGLSSDPEMNRRLSILDGVSLISNSDAHSGENLAREANLFSGELSYSALFQALSAGTARAEDSHSGTAHFEGTLEFFPDEGKYHLDGHRACHVCLTPDETRKLQGICPVCGKPLTVGVLSRVFELADRAQALYRPDETFSSVIPLPELMGEMLGVGSKSKRVGEMYHLALGALGSELSILQSTPLDDIAQFSAPLAEGIGRMREGKVRRRGGYDGEYGVISVFTPEEQRELKASRTLPVHGRGKSGKATIAAKDVDLFPMPGSHKSKTTPACGMPPVNFINHSTTSDLRNDTPMPEQPYINSDEFSFDDDHPVSGTMSHTGATTAKEERQPSPTLLNLPPRASQKPISTEANTSEAFSGGLNKAQVLAVRQGPGPVLVLAGPGTGKTHTLIARIRHLLQDGADPARIVAVTFTRRAAQEMRRRLEAVLPKGSEIPKADTLHALSLDLWQKVQNEKPLVLTEEEAWRIFCETNAEESAAVRKSAWESINLCREKLEELPPELVPLMERYTQHKSAWNLADYTDLLEFWLAQCRSGLFPPPWGQVLVDEIQDLSPLQLALVKSVCLPEGEGFFGIGDPDQSIYGFRGAHGEADSYFRQAWPQLKVIHLTDNYRSGAEILTLAQSVFHKRDANSLLKPHSGLLAEIHFFEAGSAESEAAWVAQQVLRALGSGSHSLQDRIRESSLLDRGDFTPGDIAILSRSRALMRPLRKAFERAGVPFSQPSEDPFWHDPLVGKILAIAGRMLGISPAGADDDPLGDSALDNRPSATGALPECPDAVLLRGPLSMAAYWGTSEPFDARFWKSRAFKELTASYEAHHGWPGLFNWLGLQNDLELARERSEQVQLLTIHAAKGLEFPLVFMPALEDGLLPFAGPELLSGRAPRQKPDVEEERRLFYVGMTRAKEGLFLSCSSKRRLFGREIKLKPSRFLTGLPMENVRHSAMVAKKQTKIEQLKLL